MTTNKLYITVLYVLSILLFASCDKEYKCIRGSGAMRTKSVDLSAFSGVDLRLPGDVEIIKSSTYKIEMEAQENIIDLIRTSIIGGNLVLDMDNRCIKGRTNMHFKVYTPELGFVRVAGSGNITSPEEFPQRDWTIIIDGSGNIAAQINGNSTEAIISGSGNMHLTGTTNQFKTRISGSGDIRAFELAAQDVTANISGSGNIDATVNKTLSATISGSGNVHYKGQASVTNVNISGSGKLVKVD